MQVRQLIHPVFTSNTYVISEAGSNIVWLVDIGDFARLLSFLPPDFTVAGVFITHAHYDHIYGINSLIDFFPDTRVYISEEGKKGLYSEKINLSFYHEDPVIFKGKDAQILHEADRIELFESIFLEALETPGHNQGCLTYKVDKYLFTGDSFIPNVEVVTKLKGGDREASKKSVQKILSNISEDTIVCAGHGDMTRLITGPNG